LAAREQVIIVRAKITETYRINYLSDYEGISLLLKRLQLSKIK